ncbi:hypothetical protein P9250_05445 [Caballeronia sp. LP006]|uniref:hypothetical protein n=1 Tax=unclassified Caballeronia TaxID=2646786 RepID=UPI0020296F96|nr:MULTISPECIES: hypothetical protein [unclassified Caballeronia]MDR5827308.1 hypothetical protein [Caballeronia sp. LP006]
MYVFSWLLSMIVALVATGTIVLAMPRSAADELSVATAPHTFFSSELNRMTTMLASCVTDAD